MIRYERMSAEFEKWHLEGRSLHHFTGPDRGGPHDHPFDFETTILSGGYVERIYQPDGQWQDVKRLPGTSHTVAAECVHEIITVPPEGCWTLCAYGEHARETRFWDFTSGEPRSRAWHEGWPA